VPTLNEAKINYTQWSLQPTAIQNQLIARINEVTQQIGSPTLLGYPTGTVVSSAATGNGPSTVYDFGEDGREHNREAVLVRVTTTVGSTPTATFAIQGSEDNSSWSALNYADSATPQTVVATTFVITSATTVMKIVQPGQVYRYLRVNYSLNTNVTITTDVYPLGD